MKKLSFALACAASVAAFATTIDSIGFEDYTAGFTGLSLKGDNGSEGAATLSHWLYQGASGSEDGSTVKAYGNDNLTAPTTGGDAGSNYLELSTEGGTLWRSIGTLQDATTLGEAESVGTDGLYVDTMVQFTPTEDGGTPEVAGADKLAIWLNVDSSVSPAQTNLCVLGSYFTTDAFSFEQKVYKATNVAIEPSIWYRLTVKAIADIADGQASQDGCLGFKICIDGTELTFDSISMCANALAYLTDDDLIADIQANKIVPNILASNADVSLQAVGFKGSGALDNLGITDTDPLPPAPASDLDFTITAPANTTVEWSKDNGVNWTTYAAGAKAPAGDILIRLTTTDGGVKVLTKALSSSTNAFDVSDTTFGWPEYLGAAIAENTYGIDDLADLTKFQAKCLTLGTAGITFRQTADIALSGEWTGIGAFDAKDVLGTPATYSDGAFKGTYDGDNHTISGLVLQRGDYVGFFGSTFEATVKNLKISLGNTTGWGSTSTSADTMNNYGGAVFVGVAVKTTIENCETLAVGENVGITASKALAGIVGFAAAGTTVKGCVNNLAITTANEKGGGILAISQQGNAAYGSTAVVVDSCTNHGAVACTTAGKVFAAGIFSYVNFATTFKGANVNTATVTLQDGTAGSSICSASGVVPLIDEGATLEAPAGYKAYYNAQSSPADGLMFATVEGNTATLVKNSAVVNGANLKVMAAGAPTITLANVNDTITLDTTLFAVSVTTSATDAYVAHSGNVYKVTAKGDADFTVTVSPESAEWTASLAFPEPQIEGTTATGTWSPDQITEPTAGTTNTYTYTVTVAATDTTKETTKSATFKVWKAAAYPTYIGSDTEKQAKYNAWAQANSVTDPNSEYEKAYLLNVAPADAAAAEAAFEIKSITINADGSATVVTTAGPAEGKAYNGTIEIRGSATLTGTYTTEAVTGKTAKFFKAFLK